MIIKDDNFKKEFWEWFDSLPKEEKKKFQIYRNDMAELYFYNKIYSKKSTLLGLTKAALV